MDDEDEIEFGPEELKPRVVRETQQYPHYSEDHSGAYRTYSGRKRPHYLEGRVSKIQLQQKNQNRADLIHGERLDQDRTGGPFNHFFDPAPLVDHAGYSGNPNHPRQPRLLNPWTHGTLSDDEHQ